MKISLLLCLFYCGGFALLPKAQTNTSGFYDSLFVLNHPEVTRHRDSILAYYERTTLETLTEMENELGRIREYYSLYQDSLVNLPIYCGGITDWQQVLEYQKQTFIKDKVKIRAWFERSTVINLVGILDLILNRDNLAYMIDKYRNSSPNEHSLPDYTSEILTELIRRNNAPLVTN
jgi:hypothetical protein